MKCSFKSQLLFSCHFKTIGTVFWVCIDLYCRFKTQTFDLSDPNYTSFAISSHYCNWWKVTTVNLNPGCKRKSSFIEMINNKARHNLIDAKCRWLSDRLDGTGSFLELLGQTKVMQIRQGETQIHQGAITHKVCCLSAQ